jgi:hypothetical protein
MDNTKSPTVLDIQIHVAGALAGGRPNVVRNLMPDFLASPEESA